jgi:hypothetical protein
MSAYVDRTTPSGYGSFTIIFNEDHEPKAVGTHAVRLAKWEEHTGTVEVLVAHEDVPAYAAALLAEYVKIEAEHAAHQEAS